MEVFMDHTSRPSAAVNHQAKKTHSVHGKPEWQKSAIRTCGNWSEQLSSKGKVYFYNCMTEVSQWQKPPEWSLPEMNRKDLLKLLNDRKHIEERNLKRPYSQNDAELIHTKDERLGTLNDIHKRVKYCNSIEIRKPTTSHNDHTFSSQVNNSLPRTSAADINSKLNYQSSHTYRCDVNRELPRKSKIVLLHSGTTADDMDISPNSSPLSDSSSTLCSAGKGQSPRRTSFGNSPNCLTFQRPQPSKLRSAPSESLMKSDRSALHQLVDTIQASIGCLLEQSPSSISKLADKIPTPNGTVYGFCKMPLEVSSNTSTSHIRSPVETPQKIYRQPQSVIERSKSPGSCPNQSNVLPNLQRAHTCTVSSEFRSRDTLDRTLPDFNSTASFCNKFPMIASLPLSEASRRTSNSNRSPSVSRSASSTLADRRVVPQIPNSVYRNTLPNSSPVIPNSHSPSQTTSSSASVHSSAPLSTCELPLHQMDELLEILNNRTSQCARVSERRGTDMELEVNSSTRTENYPELERVASSERCTRLSQYNHQFVPELPVNDTGGSTLRSHHTQLNDLVQVLKAALHHHNSAQSAHNQIYSATQTNSRSSCARASHASPYDSNKICSVDNKNQSNKAASIVSPQEKASSFSQIRLGVHTINRISSTSYPSESQKEASLSPSTYNLTKSHTVGPGQSELQGQCTHATNSPISASSLHSDRSVPTTFEINTKRNYSPTQLSDNNSNIEKIVSNLDNFELRSFCDSSLISKYQDDSLQRLEQEAHIEAKNFDRLQSVLYAELSAESKKLRALVRISEAKLAIHKEKQTSLQELMDVIEARKHLPNLSFVEDVL